MSEQTSEIPPPGDAQLASPEPTAPIAGPPSAAFRPGQVALVFVAVAAAAFLIGILVASVTGPGRTDNVLVETEVGPSGRTIRFAGGQLVFPPGALRERIRIVVASSRVEGRVRVKTEDDPVVVEPGELVAYSFEPSDVTFLKPVEITFRLPRGARNGTVFARRGDEIILLTGTVDPARSTATVRVRSFAFNSSGGSDR